MYLVLSSFPGYNLNLGEKKHASKRCTCFLDLGISDVSNIVRYYTHTYNTPLVNLGRSNVEKGRLINVAKVFSNMSLQFGFEPVNFLLH